MSGRGLGFLNVQTPFKETFITQVDPRVKLFFTLTFLIVIIISKQMLISITIMLFTIIGLIFLKTNWRALTIRVAPIFFIAVTVLVSQVFLYGKTQLFLINIFGLQIYGYHEGFAKGILLMFRIFSGSLLMLFLTMSTSVSRLIFAAKWFRFPNAFLEVLTIAYRYIFVLFEEIITVKNARKMRLGFATFKSSLQSFGSLSGIIIIRAIDKSEKLYRSMRSRGYNGGDIGVYCDVQFVKSDWLVTIGLICILGMFLLISF